MFGGYREILREKYIECKSWWPKEVLCLQEMNIAVLKTGTPTSKGSDTTLQCRRSAFGCFVPEWNNHFAGRWSCCDYRNLTRPAITTGRHIFLQPQRDMNTVHIGLELGISAIFVLERTGHQQTPRVRDDVEYCACWP